MCGRVVCEECEGEWCVRGCVGEWCVRGVRGRVVCEYVGERYVRGSGV